MHVKINDSKLKHEEQNVSMCFWNAIPILCIFYRFKVLLNHNY